MSYDTANRLQTANAAGLWGNATFAYDDSDNLRTATVGGVSTSFTIDAATNRATAMVVGGVSTPLQYDGQGHLPHKGTRSFTFDRSDLLLGLPGQESHRYDADGRRTVTEINGGQRVSIYDSARRLLEELEPAPQTSCASANDRVFCSSFEKPPVNAAETRYVYLGRHLIGKDDSQGRHYLQTDALGSLLAETDQSQTITKRYHYLPFGGAHGAQPDGPGYTGAVMDPIGLVCLQARYYDPQLGRFLSTDPVDPDPQTGANFNRYAYAEDNPYSKYDPNGRCGTDIPDQEDVAGACSRSTSDSSQLPSLTDVRDAIDSTLAAMGPLAAEVSGAERAGVAAAEEVAEATSKTVQGLDAVGEGSESALSSLWPGPRSQKRSPTSKHKGCFATSAQLKASISQLPPRVLRHTRSKRSMDLTIPHTRSSGRTCRAALFGSSVLIRSTATYRQLSFPITYCLS